MASQYLYVPDPEQLGRRRFPDNKSFRKQLSAEASRILTVLQSLLPSNYSKEPITNLAIWNRVLAREFARMGISMGSISLDKQYTETRVQYLQQILGERLFLTDRIAPANYDDESYRNYLISIKDAYLKGSRKTDIEALASKFTGLTVNIKELYLEARKPESSVTVTDTHKMIVEVFIDDMLKAGYDINKLKSDLDFFINLVRPAHVLYDTKLIWAEYLDVNKTHDVLFGDTGGGCVPLYDYLPFDEPTIFAQQVFVLPSSTGATGQIDSIHHPDSVFYLADSTRVVVDPNITTGTKIYDINGRQITLNGLSIGNYVRINYQVIPGSFQFWYPPSIVTSYYSQFYPEIYRRPIFQEFVKKQMDSHGRFPLQIRTTPTTICDRWVHDAMQPMYEDMRGNCSAGVQRTGKYSSELHDRMCFPRLTWPYDRSSISDQELLGSGYIMTLPLTPVTDGSSNPASVSDVSSFFNGTPFTGLLTSIDTSSGRIELTSSRDYWDASSGRTPVPGDEFIFGYHYLHDGTNYDTTSGFVFGIGYWQMPHNPIVSGDGSGSLAGTGNVSLSVDGTQITNAVTGLSPLLGHILVNQSSDFWRDSSLGRLPRIGDTFTFSYYWGARYQYSMLFDNLARTFDSYPGSISPYGLVFDVNAGGDPESSAIAPTGTGEIGYRYRAYLLHHSSVLNSPDTLNFNEYAKPAKRASIINQVQTLNHFNKFFSAEFLYDTNSNIILDDQYLENGLDPVVKLKKGTPTFQQTFGYQPTLISERKLQDIRTHHHPLMYSDLLLKEFAESDDDVSLSSICDSESITFKIRIGEDEVPKPSECPPWIVFDTIDSTSMVLSIPGDYRGVPNIRVTDKKLRDNLILRELEPSGVASYSYTVVTTIDNPATTKFYLPSTIPYNDGTYVYDFPSLPVMKDATTVADITDISVTVDGAPHNIVSFDPYTGYVELEAFSELTAIEMQVTVTPVDVGRSFIYLPGIPLTASNVTLTIGTAQYYGTDFYVYGRTLSWYGTPLDGIISAGDVIRVSYEVDPLIAATVVFTYKIKSTAVATIIDPTRSRIMDNGYVFGGMCPDGPKSEMDLMFKEYITFLSDYSEGIKLSFFNKDTVSVENHVFSGPVFEMYDAGEDQIGSPDNFHNALVRIRNSLQGNPLRSLVDYGFVNDQLARFRKKTFKELLPDRTFRTLKITEMLPI